MNCRSVDSGRGRFPLVTKTSESQCLTCSAQRVEQSNHRPSGKGLKQPIDHAAAGRESRPVLPVQRKESDRDGTNRQCEVEEPTRGVGGVGGVGGLTRVDQRSPRWFVARGSWLVAGNGKGDGAPTCMVCSGGCGGRPLRRQSSSLDYHSPVSTFPHLSLFNFQPRTIVWQHRAAEIWSSAR